MANLALGKVPLEKDVWKNPEAATDGNTTNYGNRNNEGYAAANWPCQYTIDLDNEKKIESIRILLFDNLGKPNYPIADRKYTFSVSLSPDGDNYYTVYSNKDQEGGLGWYAFVFNNETHARFVRIEGHSNSKNTGFHIVQFEIHDERPTPIKDRHVQEIHVRTAIPSENKLRELINANIAQKAGELEELKNLVNDLNKAQAGFESSLSKIDFFKETKDFTDEASRNRARARNWLWASGVAFVIFLILLLYFLFSDGLTYRVLERVHSHQYVEPYGGFVLGSYYVTKAILLSVLLFVFTWFLKNYRAEKHNYVINKHKAMSLLSVTGVLTMDQLKEIDKTGVLLKALEIVYMHQGSGFSGEQSSDPPNVVTTLLHQIPKSS